jgi:hypothetical protein
VLPAASCLLRPFTALLTLSLALFTLAGLALLTRSLSLLAVLALALTLLTLAPVRLFVLAECLGRIKNATAYFALALFRTTLFRHFFSPSFFFLHFTDVCCHPRKHNRQKCRLNNNAFSPPHLLKTPPTD